MGGKNREAEVPEAGDHLWAWFWRLNARRQHADGSPQPISHSEIKAWRENTGFVLCPEEVDVLTEMDSAFIAESVSELRGRQSAAGNETPRPKRKYGSM